MNDNSSQTGQLEAVIVGGGLGGLCLAQGLRRSGINVAVYERDHSAYVRRQGYRISVKDTGVGALHDCLPENLFDLAVSTSIKSATRMVFLDEQLRPKFAKPIPQREPGLSGFGVNRLTPRDILLAGLDEVVHFGKALHHYEHAGDGRVQAHFADGTTTLRHQASATVTGWHPAIRRIFAEADIAATFPIAITSVRSRQPADLASAGKTPLRDRAVQRIRKQGQTCLGAWPSAGMHEQHACMAGVPDQHGEIPHVLGDQATLLRGRGVQDRGVITAGQLCRG